MGSGIVQLDFKGISRKKGKPVIARSKPRKYNLGYTKDNQLTTGASKEERKAREK